MTKVNKLLKKRIEENNEELNQMERESLGVIFQYVSLTGVFLMFLVISVFVSTQLEQHLEFETPKPTITLDGSFLTDSIRKKIVKEKMRSYLSIKSDYEKALFIENEVAEVGREGIRKFINKRTSDSIQVVISKDVKAIFLEIGDIVRTKTAGINNTITQASILVKEVIPSREFLENEVKYKLYSVSLDKDFKFIKIAKAPDETGIKNLYLLADKFESLTKENFWYEISSISKDRYPYIENITIASFRKSNFQKVTPTKGVGIVEINNIRYNLHLEVDGGLVYIDLE
jgi:hypothetical protein